MHVPGSFLPYLISEHAESPPVARDGVAGPCDHLGRDVARGAAERVGPTGDDLCEAKVDELRVARRVDENVLRLEVAVGDALRVQVAKRRRDAGAVEARGGLVQSPTLAVEKREELAALHQLEHQHGVRVRMPGGHQPRDQMVVARGKQVLFEVHPRLVVLIRHVRFLPQVVPLHALR